MGIRLKIIGAIIVTAVVILAAFAVLVYQNGEDDDDAHAPPAIFQPEFDEALQNVTVGNDTVVYTYDSDPGKLNYSVDSIIVGTAGYGYLRKITGIEQNGNVVTLMTENAALTDVIENGEIYVNQTLDLGSGTRASTSIDLGCTMYSSGGTSVGTTGAAAITTDVFCHATIKNWKLTDLEFYTDATISSSLCIRASHSITLEKETLLYTRTLAPIVIPVVTPLVVIPIVLTPILEISIGAELTIEGGIETTVNTALTIRGGVQYQSGSWSLINTVQRSASCAEPTADVSAEAKAYAILPKVDLIIMGILGPHVELSPYMRLSASSEDDPWWTVYAGLEGSAGVKMEIFDYEIVDYSAQLFQLEWIIAQAKERTVPSEPQNITLIPGDSTISLSWDPPVNNGSCDITEYRIYRGNVSGGEAYITNVSEIEYEDTGLVNDQTYYYRISAVNEMGEGNLSHEKNAMPFTSLFNLSKAFRINSDDDFEKHANGGGNGTTNNPWIIENYDINGLDYGYCIYIGNTTDCFVVRDCCVRNLVVNSLPYWMGGLVLYNAQNGYIDNNLATNMENGIYLHSSDGNTITNNNPLFIYLDSSTDNSIAYNTFWNTGAIFLTSSNNNIIANNSVSFSSISLESSSYNSITYNGLLNSSINVGGDSNSLTNNHLLNSTIYIYSSSNIIVSNTLSRPVYLAAYILLYISTSSGYNQIYHNNFYYHQNNSPCWTDNATNQWDNGAEGNYWSHYDGADADSDGVGDTPYWISGVEEDNYPLMNPVP